MKHRSSIAIAAIALLGVAAAPAPGDAEDPDASATAVEVDGVAAVSATTASEGESSATVVSVADETVVGGESDGGDGSGEVVDAGDAGLGRLSIGSWEATTSDGGSSAESSVAHVTVRDEDTAQVTVLRSRSEADGHGTGSAATSAAAIRLGGGDEIHVLSSTWDEDGPSSALIRQGDDTIGEDPDGQCALEIPSVLHLLCLTGSDGLGGSVAPGATEHEEVASVLEASLLGQLEWALFRAGGDPVAGPSDADTTAPSPTPGPDNGSDDAPQPGDDIELAAAPDSGGGSLPMTGGGLVVGAFGLLLLAAGLLLHRSAVLA